jgi:hypothetical protein
MSLQMAHVCVYLIVTRKHLGWTIGGGDLFGTVQVVIVVETCNAQTLSVLCNLL